MCRKVRQDSRQTSSKDGKAVLVLCEDSVSESDGIGAGGAAKTATHLRECDARQSRSSHKCSTITYVQALFL